MLKKLLLSTAIVFLLFLFGCKAPQPSPPSYGYEPIEVLTDEVIEVQIDSVEGLTVDEARALFVQVKGETDEETGSPRGFRCDSAIIYEGKTYYVIHVMRQVSDYLYSWCGDYFVSADGDEMISGVKQPDGFYYFGRRVIWDSVEVAQSP